MKQTTMNRLIYFLRLPVDYGGELFFSALFSAILTAVISGIIKVSPMTLPFTTIIGAWGYASIFSVIMFVFFFYVIYGFVKSDMVYKKVTVFEHWLHCGYKVDEQLICDAHDQNRNTLPDEFVSEIIDHCHEQGFGLFSRKYLENSSYERNSYVWIFKRKQDGAAFKMKYATKG